ncbi:MAG: hypothetical protein JW708_01295, partial [Vallitaleaceae bacterium]|nr:hypothetical protein [Vallitaleaceae bacterium]
MKKGWKLISLVVVVTSILLFSFVLYSFLTTMRSRNLRSTEAKDIEKMIALSISNQEELESLIFEEKQLKNGAIQEKYVGNTRTKESKEILYRTLIEELKDKELLSFQVLDDQYIMARYQESEEKLFSVIYSYELENVEEENYQFTLLHQREDDPASYGEQSQLSWSSSYANEEYDVLRTQIDYNIEESRVQRYRPQSVFRYYITKSPNEQYGILLKSRGTYFYSADTYFVNLETEEEEQIATGDMPPFIYGGSNWKPDSSRVVLSGQKIFNAESKETTEIQLPFGQEKIMAILGRDEEILMLVQKGLEAPYEYEWHAFDWLGNWQSSTPIIGILSDEMGIRQAAILDEEDGTVLLQVDSYLAADNYGVTYLIKRNGEVKELENALDILPLPWNKQFLAFRQRENLSIDLHDEQGEVLDSRSYE